MADFHPAEQYVDDVLSGVIPACKLVKQSAQRHLDDLERGSKRGLVFDADEADRVIRFFSHLKHSKGKWAGSEFALEGWQQFILWSLFGWKRKQTGKRRFREGYIEVARKNGKSTTWAGIGIFGTIADHEPGAEIYTGATKKDQAAIIHKEAVRMVRGSEELGDLLDVFRNSISHAPSQSRYEPLGADSKTLDGLNVHMALIDELHAHKDRSLYDVIDSATGAREQPLILSITTAGNSQDCFCYEQHQKTEAVLGGAIEDDSFFGIIYELDEDDDWKDERCWVKANPNLGVSVYLDGMRDAFKKALEQPSAQPNFQCKRLNRWVNVAGRFLSIEDWANCAGRASPEEIEAMAEGRRIYCGLDLSISNDLTALVALVEPDEGEPWDVFCRFWCPGDDLAERSARTGIPFTLWSDEGWLSPTAGPVVDFTMVGDEIKVIADRCEIGSLGYDPTYARLLVEDLLGEGVPCHEVRQGWKTISPAMVELERWIMARQIAHGGNPILRWMASNLQAKTDSAGNIMPVKPDASKSNSKIDGMVALIMAIDRATAPTEEAQASVYAERGILSL